MRFTDKKGREWAFVCDTFTLARVKKETGVDLAKAAEPGTEEHPNKILDDVLGDIAVFFDVILSLLQDDLKDSNVSHRDLGSAMDEDTMIQAAGALVDAVLSFSPADRAKPMRAAFDRFWTLTRKKADSRALAAMRKLEQMDFETLSEAVVNGEDIGEAIAVMKTTVKSSQTTRPDFPGTSGS